ncbi:MAG: hypothetical protein IR158_05470 [Cellulomonas sp.]|uniref:hypothetical protein n=1 Tax=Cellulomonas sp. TaxID=40001 RepID=UPI0019F728AC|nr:hypothetical protein [Cellulomonas sp.]MBF0686353.1 hypothetical protein [Cellulomonas sp.]MBF0687205.1 hypothetical protein [Cellulomonas sp.]
MKRYNFYGFLTVELNTRHRGYRRYFDNEYLRIAQGDPAAATAATIRVHVVDDLPDARPGDIVRHTRYKRLFTYRTLVRGLETDQVDIYFGRHWVDRVYMNAIGVFLQAQVLEPVMYYKLLHSGVLFMHAAGVTKDGEAIALPAYGGTGKTTLSIALLAQGFRFLGDDLLFVDTTSGIVHPYPRPLHIFTYNVRSLVGARIPLRYRAAVYGKNAIRFVLERVLRTEFLISTRIHADEIFPGDVFGSAAPVGGIGFLRKDGPATTTVDVGDDNARELAAEVARSADLNDSMRDLVSGDATFDERFTRLELDVIESLLRRAGRLTYVNTRALTDADRARFADLVHGQG